METDVRKIVFRGLITLISIFLIVILNEYLDYRLEMLPENSEIIREVEIGDKNHFLNIGTEWDHYSTTYVNIDIPEISRKLDKEEVSNSVNPSFIPGKNGE